MIEIVEKAAERVGGLTKLAAVLNMNYRSFHSWRRVPAERVLEIERATGITRHQLRPDLFGDAPDQQAQA